MTSNIQTNGNNKKYRKVSKIYCPKKVFARGVICGGYLLVSMSQTTYGMLLMSELTPSFLDGLWSPTAVVKTQSQFAASANIQRTHQW